MIVDLELNDYGTDLGCVFRAAQSAGLNPKSSSEISRCWDVVQIWRDWFEQKFGEFKFMRHRSPPDDPPDVELIFANKVVPFEDTRLQPEHFGRADALRGRQIAPHPCALEPAISKPIRNNRNLVEKMLCVSPLGFATNLFEERAALRRLLSESIRKKMDRLPNGGIIAMIDEVAHMGRMLEFLFQTAEALITGSEFCGFDNYALVVQNRATEHRYRCAMITRQHGRVMRAA